MKLYSRLAAALVAGIVATPAWAQSYTRPATSPFPQPTVSPYLNLLRAGNVAVNYYDLVRPQQQVATTLQTLQHQVNATSYTATATRDALLETGHPVLFLNLSHYYSGRPGTSRTSGQSNNPVKSPIPQPKLAGSVQR
jgi:hypothetical protein